MSGIRVNSRNCRELTFWMGCHMAAGQSGPGGVKQLTSWVGFHGCTSAKQAEARRRTETHTLEGISWVHISEANGGKEEHCNSHTGRDFMGACQRSKRRSGGAQQLTYWKGFHRCTSANKMEARKSTSTHILEGISWVHVSKPNRGP